MTTITIPIKLLNKYATTPVYSKSGDAAMDLYSSEDVEIPPMDVSLKMSERPVGTRIVVTEITLDNRKLVSTGVQMAIPVGYYGRVAPRSGLSCKGLDIGAGVIDAGYRGEIKILAINNSNNNFCVLRGERIAQLIITKIANPVLEVVDELPPSDRGESGFGSTGLI